ncbi:LOW QUALITY PROTEIN: RNA-binding protein MEX3D [Peromyscus californicus insignis]|uniref:LOW QUALITY PROTEIN: RNA-binding protein MEX3D n=1 Tax=Peromyscus californicus insignis TaxID=564181 RepID=UPI0022A6AF23|nr:LOW QUALITY PROTEIN: RNA-binding protein MEX3D [Peromyscus californicus insignis]
MPGSSGQPDAGGAGTGTTAGDPGHPRPVLAGAEDAAPRPPPEPDDAAAALRLALDQLSALGLGGARPGDEEGTATRGADGAAERGEDGPAPPDELETAVAPPVTGAPSMGVGPSVMTGAPSMALAPSVMTGAPSMALAPSVTGAPSMALAPSVTSAPSMAVGPSVTCAPCMAVAASVTVAPSMALTPSVTVAPSVTVGHSVTLAPAMAVPSSVAPGGLPLLDPDVSPRPSPPDVFASFAPHPAALGPSTLLAEQLNVIGSRKKSVNMTECVPVPSSEHVAEIVGRQGCKIKALRAKTNTYIKTPVRGEEPVFIVTGRKEDVEMAKREILSAAEHFSLIRATRSKAGGLSGATPGPPNLPGQTTIQVRVPYRVVGLVVGPKGATIKRIQQRTHTYIVTPGRDKEPVFAVTGMPENVDRAREEIEAHITLRTGAFTDAGPDSDFHANGTDVCLDLLGAAASLWAKAPHPARRPPAAAAASGLRGDSALGAASTPEPFYVGGRGGPPLPDPSPGSPYGGSGNGGFTFGGDGPGAPAGTAASEDCDFGFDFLALDLTVPATATIWAPFERAAPLPAFGACPAAAAVNGAPAQPGPGARRSSSSGGGGGAATTPRHSPTLPEPGGLGLELPLARRGVPDPVGAVPWRPPQSALPPFSGGSAAFPGGPSLPSPAQASSALDAAAAAAAEGNHKPSTTAAANSSSAPAAAPGPPAAALARECVVCAEGEAMAALVPCGHNLFCMDCAVRICGKSEPECPACRTPATQAIHIFS